MRLTKKLLAATCSLIALNMVAHGAIAQETISALEPEVVSTVFEEDGKQKAEVSINGKSLVKFDKSAHEAANQAEQLASKIDDLFNLDKSTISNLLPSSEGCTATLKVQGNTLLRLEIPEGEENAMMTSLELVNAIRAYAGSPLIPQSASGVLLGDTEGSQCFSGRASWYGGRFHGRRTSNGETFDKEGMTAAHRTLPFGTKLLVTNRNNGQSCVVKVNDRGPFHDNRVLDLSMAAARKLNLVSSGVGVVDCFVLGAQ